MSKHLIAGATLVLLTVFVVPSWAENSVAESLPPDSIYHLDVALQTQTGAQLSLDLYRGQPTVVTMFYASCPHVCPMIVSTIKLTESKLMPDERAAIRVLAISVDPVRDDPERLLETFEDHSLDDTRWSMARPEENDLRSIAGVLGIKYKKLPSGEYSHSTKLLLLDADGRIVASTSKLGRVDPAFLDAIRTAL